MAHDTDIQLRQQVIYSVYVRAHTPEGTFKAIVPDLERIRALGVDIIWFMPIHPIGVKGKKGSLGCPYANRDYRSVNPEYGTMEDFRALVDAIHALGMKVMIDVVYNHTSPDSVLLEEHPEFFYRDSEGKVGNKIGDWADVIDLDYAKRALWDYQIESLKFWAAIVDGFRCDVASFVPVEFWNEARRAVREVRPDAIFLAESVHRSFGNFARSEGFYSARDTELFSAFDMEYSYDIREAFDAYVDKGTALSSFLDLMNFQEAVYAENYDKMRCLENHDQPRFASRVKGQAERENWTALLYFAKGTTLLYAGQEFCDEHLPSLFEKEPIDRSGRDISAQLRALYAIKQRLGADDSCLCEADDEHDIAVLVRKNAAGRKLGVFSLKGKAAELAVKFPDGVYTNALSGEHLEVKDGRLRCEGRPIILFEHE